MQSACLPAAETSKELRAITEAKVKTDRHNARTLARLPAAGLLNGCWLPNETTRSLRRRLARRAQLVRQRTRCKNEAERHLGRRDLATKNAYSQRAHRERERELSAQAELAYSRFVADWQATGPAKVGAGATPGRASQGPSKGQAARQTQ
jgi:transposase